MTKSPVKSHSTLGDPAPQVVVGFTTGVVEFDRVVADGDGVVIVDDMIRAQRRGRNELGRRSHSEVAAYTTELAGVDAYVPVVGVGVSVESVVDVAVADHGHAIECGGEVRAPADVVGMPVGVHEVADRRGGPALDGRDDVGTGSSVRGVERDEPLARVEHDAVAEALDDRQPVGQLRQLVGDPVDRFVDHARIDDPGGQCQEISHPQTLGGRSDGARVVGEAVGGAEFDGERLRQTPLVTTRIDSAMPISVGEIKIWNRSWRSLRYGARFLPLTLVSTDTSATLPQPVGRMKSIDIVPPLRSSKALASSVISICMRSG